MARDKGPISFFYICGLSGFPKTIYWRDHPFLIVSSWHTCQILVVRGLFLNSSLFHCSMCIFASQVASGKESTCQCRRWGFEPWVRKILWRRKWQPTPVFLPGKSYGQRNLVAYSSWGHKQSDTTEHTHTQILIGPERLTVQRKSHPQESLEV